MSISNEVLGSLKRLLDYGWDSESKHFEVCDQDERDNHIFLDMQRVARWLLDQ